jgi:hypothetical protein
MRTEAPAPTRSATLGRRLRSVLVAPAAGFEAAISTADRRARSGESLAEGLTPYVLSILGGSSLMIGWLKIGGLLGGRDVDPTQFGFAELIFALVTGAVLAMLGQAVFGVVASPVSRAFRGGLSGRDARIVWGAAAFPQAFTVLVLLPLDLIIVGPEIFATTKPGDSLATGWASVSIALGLLMTGWSISLFARGVPIVGHLNLLRAIGAVIVAAACLSLVIVAGSLILLSVWG